MTTSSAQDRSRRSRVLTAYQIMQDVYNQCQAAGVSVEQTHRAIRAAYPWGERRAWPYKAWLQARREFYERHGLPLRPSRAIEEVLQEHAS